MRCCRSGITVCFRTPLDRKLFFYRSPRKVVFSSRLWLEPTTFRGAKGDIIDLPFPAKGGLPVGRHAKEKTSFRGAKGDNECSTQFFPH